MGSMIDTWDYRIPLDYRTEIISVTKACPQHTFIFLTKDVEGYFDETDVTNLNNTYLGFSINGGFDYDNIELFEEHYKVDRNFFLSIEPVLEPLTKLPELRWKCFIIGALTGEKLKTKKSDVMETLEYLEKEYPKVPIFMKDNLKTIGITDLRKELPWKN